MENRAHFSIVGLTSDSENDFKNEISHLCKAFSSFREVSFHVVESRIPR